jgi:cyclopropane fatty-acyl-phospholipid synthase-like methyltransferase
MTDPKRLVERGYDVIADRYTELATSDADLRMQHVAKLDEVLHGGSEVLELGCGAGVPVARALAQRHSLTGIDISKAQIDRARRNVPNGRFFQADMMTARFSVRTFDAVVALFSITHLPREEHPELLSRIRAWLRPGGYLLANMASADDPGTIEGDWMGVPMFFSGFDASTNKSLIEDAGFDTIEEEVVTHEEDGRTVAFLWVLAQAMHPMTPSRPADDWGAPSREENAP